MKYIIITLIFFINLSTIHGQDRPYRKYSTQKVARKMLQGNTELKEAKKTMECKIRRYIMPDTLTDITIPIIFHNVYNKNKQKISPDLIISQLEVLNRAFRMEYDWKHPGHHLENLDAIISKQIGIQFCLANVDLMNNGQFGLNYIKTDTIKWGIETTIKSENTGGVSPYKPRKYLNVWIGNLGLIHGGCAQFPWGPQETDGIVIDYRVFGVRDSSFAPYHQGKTLVHLVGSYLGLKELWDDKRACIDDGLLDTPIHNAANYGKHDYYKHISTCEGYPSEQTMNFMDATDDEFVYMFTALQVNRMRAVLADKGLRFQLTQSDTRCTNSFLLTEDISASRSNVKLENKAEDMVSVILSPNPVQSILNVYITGKADKLQVEIFNISGKRLITNEIDNVDDAMNYNIDCTNWSPGLYFMHMKSSDKKETYRFTVTK